MKNIIDKLNLNCKQFSELYEIPYTTVNQWYNGKRTPPKWVVKLFNELIESKKKGEQLEMFEEYVYETYDLKNKRSLMLRDNIHSAKICLHNCKNIYKERKQDIILRTYKLITP